MFRFSKKFVQLAMKKNERPAIPEMTRHFLEFGFITNPLLLRFKNCLLTIIALYLILVKSGPGEPKLPVLSFEGELTISLDF